MKQRRNRRQERMAKIHQSLGNTCAIRGCMRKPLTIDHIYGRDYNLANMGGDSRVLVYEKELRMGLLQLHCRYHANQQGALKKNSGFRNSNQHITHKICFCSKCKSKSKTNRVVRYFFGAS